MAWRLVLEIKKICEIKGEMENEKLLELFKEKFEKIEEVEKKQRNLK